MVFRKCDYAAFYNSSHRKHLIFFAVSGVCFTGQLLRKLDEMQLIAF